MKIPFTSTQVFMMPRSDPNEELTKWRAQVEAKPDDAEAHLRLASWLHTVGQLQEAVEEYRQAIRLYAPGANTRADFRTTGLSTLAHYHLGCVLNDLGHRAEARANWQQVVMLYRNVTSDKAQFNKNPHVKRAQKMLEKYPE